MTMTLQVGTPVRIPARRLVKDINCYPLIHWKVIPGHEMLRTDRRTVGQTDGLVEVRGLKSNPKLVNAKRKSMKIER